MNANRRALVLGGVAVAIAAIALLYRAAPSQNVRDSHASKLQNSVTSTKSPGRVIVSGTPPPLANPLANLMPDVFVSAAEKLRRLSALDEPFSAQWVATRSGDPLLLVHASYMTSHCTYLSIEAHGRSVRELLTSSSPDPRTGKRGSPDEALVAATEATLSLLPSRILPPPEIAAEVNALGRGSTVGDAPDYPRRVELFKQLSVPLTPKQRASYFAIVERAASGCERRVTGRDFDLEYQKALGRHAANGVVSAQLFNTSAGWQSPSVGQLNERDFDLLQRVFSEWQPDGIARMLVGSPSVVGAADQSWVTEYNAAASGELNSNLGSMAACSLGVSDCGPDSARFRSACVTYGGCDQPDLASLLRNVFERDGLDPTVIDREINRVVDAYRRRDLDALGIRRKQ